MKWTDNDMLRFAEFCGRYGEIGYIPETGKWHLDDLVELTTAELLEQYKRQQIPQLSSPDDLQNIRFGPGQNNDTKY